MENKNTNNSVTLLGFYGSDEVIAQSAWTSTSRELTEEKKARIPKLLEMLWSEGHETPFEKANVHFLVTCDIASHIHLLKHRIASINAESARYKELKEDKFYIPEDWTNIELGSPILFHDAETNEEVSFKPGYDNWTDILKDFTDMSNLLYHRCLEDLTPVLGRKRAKESARFFKTYNSQITADVQFNMRSFANFLKLRASEHAQVEIRDIAWEMFRLVDNIEGNPFEHTLKMIKPTK